MDVSQDIWEIMNQVNRAFTLGCSKLTFIWVPGHQGLGYNPEVDRIANEAYQLDKDPGVTLMEIQSLKRLAKKRRDDDFRFYLGNCIANSADKLNPDRSNLKRLDYVKQEVIRTPEDSILWRLRSGHNRSRHHLKRLKMVKEEQCRYCNYRVEDGFHLVAICPSLPNIAEFESKRFEMGVGTREEWNWWLFSQDEHIQSQRKSVMKLILLSKMKI